LGWGLPENRQPFWLSAAFASSENALPDPPRKREGKQ
jgi:hypothetical protein